MRWRPAAPHPVGHHLLVRQRTASRPLQPWHRFWKRCGGHWLRRRPVGHVQEEWSTTAVSLHRPPMRPAAQLVAWGVVQRAVRKAAWWAEAEVAGGTASAWSRPDVVPPDVVPLSVSRGPAGLRPSRRCAEPMGWRPAGPRPHRRGRRRSLEDASVRMQLRCHRLAARRRPWRQRLTMRSAWKAAAGCLPEMECSPAGCLVGCHVPTAARGSACRSRSRRHRVAALPARTPTLAAAARTWKLITLAAARLPPVCGSASGGAQCGTRRPRPQWLI